MKFDDRTKTWLKIVTVACTLIVTFIAVSKWWQSSPVSESRVVLVASVSSGWFKLPFIVRERFFELSNPDRLRKEIDASQALSAIKDNAMRETIIDKVSKHLSNYMFDHSLYVLRGAISPGKDPFYVIDKYWDIEVENKGSVIAKGVRLRLPGLAYVEFKSEKGPLENNYTSMIEIKELHPLEKISIEAWQTGVGHDDDFRLTHAEGVGRVLRK